MWQCFPWYIIKASSPMRRRNLILMLSMADGLIWQNAITAYRIAMAGLPSQIAYEIWQKIQHNMANIKQNCLTTIKNFSSLPNMKNKDSPLHMSKFRNEKQFQCVQVYECNLAWFRFYIPQAWWYQDSLVLLNEFWTVCWVLL